MLLEQLRLLAGYWYRPHRAPSDTLDHGRMGVAAVLAVAVAILLYLPSRGSLDETIRAGAAAYEITGDTDPENLSDEQRKRLAEFAERMAPLTGTTLDAAIRKTGLAPENALRWLLWMAALFTPISIAIVTRWEGIPRTGMCVQQNFGGLLCCILFAFSATHLPAAAVNWIRPHAAVTLAAHAWFVVLAALSLRTVVGSGITAALGGGILASGATAGVGYAASASGLIYLLASPCLLFYLWFGLRGEAGRLTGALGHQQSFRRHLEALTVNPRDADAHCQLGLLYRQRRDLPQAVVRFRQAAAIDPDDADYSFQLGRALRESGDTTAALEWLSKASRLDDKAASSEVWRELGATHLAMNNIEAALPALATYVDRREYDPEGLVYYGRALAEAGRKDEARQWFQRAIEAVKTMPDHRRRQLRHWADTARKELS
jgi:tetratricopeptide (TPR) repeat protein